MYKKFLSIALTAIMTVSAINIKYTPSVALASTGEVVTPVYFMDFTPEAGKFYDSPAGTVGRQEVAREDNPADVSLIAGDNGNVDDKIISTDDTSSRLYSTKNTNVLYSAFSKGQTQGDLNTGASGAVDDYCLKTVDASASESGTTQAVFKFPKTYGGTDDSSRKYRLEMDWKWQASNSSNALVSAGTPTGATILRLYIGGKQLNLLTRSGSDTSGDARGVGALYFGCNDFGLYGSNQKTTEAEIGEITKSAAKFTEAESGKWIHITLDLDFSAATIDLTMEGETETRQISTEITSANGKTAFANGITEFRTFGSTKAERRINFYDNVKLSTIAPPTDEQRVETASSTPYTFDDIRGSNTDISNITEDLYLPTSKSGVNVTWAVSPSSASSYIDLATGSVTRPSFADGDQTISLTPTYWLNSVSRQGTAISGIVLKVSEPADYPLEAEYLMDFSPRSDGQFYDYPQNIAGGTQVMRLPLSAEAQIFPNHTVADNMCLALVDDGNNSKIQPSTRTNEEYVAFSKGSAENDVNTGASGDINDYCIKLIDTSTSTSPNVKITFPKSYGNPECSDDFVKYRFEIDYKWQHYTSMSATSGERPTGTTWLRFYFGDNYISLYSKSGSEHTNAPDANGLGALCFTSTAFGMGATTNQIVPVGETGRITAPMLTSSASGNWTHITVDFDFEEGTIKAVIKGEGNTDRIIETSIPDGTGAGGESFKNMFMEGLSAVSIHGATGSNRRVIWADNIKISPMQTVKKTPSQKLHDANNPATVFADIKGTNSDASAVTENLALIFKKGDADVTWTVTPATATKYVKGNSGLVTRPAYVLGNQNVTLTPTYTVAGRNLVGDSINITVLAETESAREKIERLISTSPFTFNDIKGANTASNQVFTDLSLPSSAEGDVMVTWAVSPDEMSEYVAASDGTVTRPRYTDTDKTLQLVPTYSKESIVMQGRPIEITIIKNTLDASSFDVKDAYAITESDLVGLGNSLISVTGNINLPRVGKLHSSAISWSSSSPVIDVSTGIINRPFGAAKVTVVLTATVTYGDNTTVRSFDITLVDANYGTGSGYGGSGGSSGGGGGGVAFAGSAVATPDTGTTPTPGGNAVFNDIASVGWAEEYITKLYRAGVINGDGTGAFHPDRNVTREEFVKMLLLTFGIEPDEGTKPVFSDVEDGSWFESYVAKASSLGIVNGVSATEFGTGLSISRQDMAVMIARCMELKGITIENVGNSTAFGDEDSISGYALEAVKLLKDAGVLNGDANGSFNPRLFAKRAEVAKVLGILMPDDVLKEK